MMAFQLFRFTPEGAVRPPKVETILPTNADSQSTSNTQGNSSKLMQNSTSRISKLEKLFSDEITSYASITSGIDSQYFFFCYKIRQLEPGGSDSMLWKIPSVNFVFDSAKVLRPSSDPLVEPATNFGGHIFRTHPRGYNFFIKFYPYGIGSATGKSASILFNLFPGDCDNLLRCPFSKLFRLGIRDHLNPLNT